MPSSDPVSPVPGFLVREGGAGRRRQEEKELGEGEGSRGGEGEGRRWVNRWGKTGQQSLEEKGFLGSAGGTVFDRGKRERCC